MLISRSIEKNWPISTVKNLPIQTVKHVPIQSVKNVPIHTEKMVTTLKTTESIQTNVEIPKKIFSENQNAVKDAKINYSSGVKQNHQTTKKKKNLFDCHPYTIFGNFASNIKVSLRKYDDKNTIRYFLVVKWTSGLIIFLPNSE